MDYAQYGDHITVSGDIDFTTTDDNPIGVAGYSGPAIDLYGHSLVMDDGTIECQSCDMKEEIPEIFQMSSGFYEVVYKLYIFGKFKHENCGIDFEELLKEDFDTGNTDPLDLGYDPNRVHWVGGDTYTTNGTDVKWQVPKGERFKIHGEEYEYKGKNQFIDTTTGSKFDIDGLHQRHGLDTTYKLAENTHPVMMDKTVDGAIGVGDIQGGRIDMPGTSDVTVDSDDLTDEQERTLREKATKAVKNKLYR